ncbi:hypothetical protein BH23PAT1_BH23PAT1_2790 [soil metagenome]
MPEFERTERLSYIDPAQINALTEVAVGMGVAVDVVANPYGATKDRLHTFATRAGWEMVQHAQRQGRDSGGAYDEAYGHVNAGTALVRISATEEEINRMAAELGENS